MIIDNKEVYGIVYKITNTINNKSYIGITKSKRGFGGRYYYKASSNSEKVFKFHNRMRELGKYYNKHLLSSMEQYGFDAFEVCEVLDTANNKEELSRKEIYYIDYYDSFNNGYNNTLGGETGCGVPQPKGKDNPLSVPVCQLTLDGQLIKVWDSLADIRRSGEYNIPNIELTCQGINSQSYGYLWVFKKDYSLDKQYKWKPSNNYKGIVLLDDDGNFIKEFVSIKEASEELNIDRTTVRATCNKKWEKPKYNLMFKKEFEYIGEQRLNEGTLLPKAV